MSIVRGLGLWFVLPPFGLDDAVHLYVEPVVVHEEGFYPQAVGC